MMVWQVSQISEKQKRCQALRFGWEWYVECNGEVGTTDAEHVGGVGTTDAKRVSPRCKSGEAILKM